jgi:hypothetical protein
MATVGMYLHTPIRNLRREVRPHLFPLSRIRRPLPARIIRSGYLHIITASPWIGSSAWLVGIKRIDDVVDTPKETTFNGMSRTEYLEHVTDVFAALVGEKDPNYIEAVDTDLAMILAVREGIRLGRPVAAMLQELWMAYLPDARRQLAGDIFPDEWVQDLANHTNHLYGVGWACLVGVPLGEAMRAMGPLTLNIFDVDNLADLRPDIEFSCAHYTKEQLRNANIDPDLLASATTWEDIGSVPNLPKWFHDRAVIQVKNWGWKGSSRRELLRLFGLAPSPAVYFYRLCAWGFSHSLLSQAKAMERISAKWVEADSIR